MEKSLAYKITRPFKEFMELEISGGLVLLFFTVCALCIANSPYKDLYYGVLENKLTINLGERGLSKSLLHWINDGLMTLFFLLVGLEIKREGIEGELSSFKRALLPAIAAFGGMLMPALIYILFNYGTDAAKGWAIPIATDIAFSLGVLRLVGSGVPLSLKVFLTALAIADDIGAIVVIAIFYTAELSVYYFILCGMVLALLVILNIIGFKHFIPYTILGVILWFFMLKSGVHATLAGVLLAFTIPHNIKNKTDHDDTENNTEEEYIKSSTLNNTNNNFHINSHSPLKLIEHTLHPWVTYLIMPLFAFANSGIPLGIDFIKLLFQSINYGVFFGLLVGKQTGIMLLTWIFVRLNIAELPKGLSWLYLYGAGWVAGIGFTMSIFIDMLSFSQSEVQITSKPAIFLASLLSGIGGWFVLRYAIKVENRVEV
ncbi:MAG: Na+/H+ antiporter NhaA [Candidatus Magnetoovum sp. WYHC-5]|nr:Na+/H+ antiporter NhaA [Candidatus Magnetoovum sp. WYHC-5]